MLDYSQNAFEKKDYILYFTKDEENIHIHYLDGEIVTKKLTEVNLNIYLNKMLKQAESALDNYRIVKNASKYLLLVTIKSIAKICRKLLFLASIITSNIDTYLSLINMLGFNILILIENNAKINSQIDERIDQTLDYAKIEFFLENREIFEKMDYHNIELYIGIEQAELIKMFYDKNIDIPININTIKFLSLPTLERLVYNYQRIKTNKTAIKLVYKIDKES